LTRWVCTSGAGIPCAKELLECLTADFISSSVDSYGVLAVDSARGPYMVDYVVFMLVVGVRHWWLVGLGQPGRRLC